MFAYTLPSVRTGFGIGIPFTEQQRQIPSSSKFGRPIHVYGSAADTLDVFVSRGVDL